MRMPNGYYNISNHSEGIYMCSFQDMIAALRQHSRTSLADYLHKYIDKPIYIYGAGCFGHELCAVLEAQDIAVAGFLDRNADLLQEKDLKIPVLLPELIDEKQNCHVILGIVMNLASRLEVEKMLKEMGYVHIVDGQSIRAHYVYAEGAKEADAIAYFENEVPSIERAGKIWADQESRMTYQVNLMAHLRRDYNSCIQTKEKRQYFVSEIPFAKGFSRFIDCGSYVGDTLEELCEVVGNVEIIAGFEPNVQNFSRLSETYNSKLAANIKQGILFPCGVSGKTIQMTFKSAGGSSSFSENGNEVIQCVALDDVLKDFAPTFIKMDIEGAEYEALQGAKQMIFRYRPDLAISVYHVIEHFYQIPLLLDSWALGYKFYLRTHSSCCMETVLYAVCPKEGDV